MTPALVLSAIYSTAFAIAYRLFTAQTRTQWLTWADQTRYLSSARAFVALDLSPASHWYPLLYPLLVAPLTGLAPWLAFGIVDLACLLIAFGGFDRVAGRFGIGRWPASAIFAATTLLYPQIVDQWLYPWTTTLSAALIWQAIAMSLDMAERRRPFRGEAARLGVILSLIPLTRPADALVIAVLGGFALLPHATRPRCVLIAAAAGGACVLAYALLHLAIYGAAATPYMRLSTEFGFSFAHFGWKAYVLLIEPRPWFPEGHGLLVHCPWLILGTAGLVTSLCRDAGRRRAAACLGAAAAVYSVAMIAYVDLLPSGLWHYNNVHYFKWLLPLFGLFAVTYLRDARRHPRTAALVLVTLTALSAVRMAPVRAAAGSPARLLLFAYHDPAFEPVYMAESTIDDQARTYRNFYEYHQVSDRRGTIHAIALRGDFEGGERWWGKAPAATPWPQTSPIPAQVAPPALAGPWPRRPVARFAVGLAWGWPCWWPGSACTVIPPVADHGGRETS